MKESISEAVGKAKLITKLGALAGDLTLGHLYHSGELQANIVGGMYKAVHKIEQIVQNPESYESLSNTVLKDLPEIALFAWLAGSVIYTGYGLVSWVKGRSD